MLGILIFIEPNSYREPLHYFHVITGRVFRREQAEERTCGTRKALYFSPIVASEGVDSDGNWLARPHPFKLRLFEVRSDPDVVQWNDHKQALSRLNAMTKLNRFSSDNAAHRCIDFRVA